MNRAEDVGGAFGRAEALVAADEEQRHAATENILDGTREIVRGGELDLGPHVRQFAIDALAELASFGHPRGDQRSAHAVDAAQVRGGVDIEAAVVHQLATDLGDTFER